MKTKKILLCIVLLISLIFVLLPFGWMISSSFKTDKEMMSLESKWLPKNPTFEHYLWVLGISKSDSAINTSSSVGLTIYLKNSIIVSVLSCILVLILSILGGFAFSRFTFKGKKPLSILFLSITFFPLILMLIPIYITLANLKLIDTYIGLIWILSASTIPFSIWMMKGFIDSVPLELEECAIVDGCTRLEAFIKITVPIITPGMVAVLGYTFMYTWGAYLEPLIICNSNRSKQLSIGLSELIGFYGQTNWGGLMAGSVLSALPIVIIFMFFQRWLIKGMTAGAVKQ